MKQKWEAWQRVILALYAEAIHAGSFAEVTRTSMGMEAGEFGWTLYVLQMRGLIEGCVFQPPHPSCPGNLMGVLRDKLVLTPKGFAAAEEMLGAQKSDDLRLTSVWEILRESGSSVLASIIYGWIS